MNAYDPNNIFAKIIRGEIPYHKVYEDADVLAFMDVMPQADGHVLVVPKLASRNLLDADPAALSKAIVIAQKVGRAVKAAFHADGVMLIQYSEAAAGQSVFHLHFHVIPRHDGIGLKAHSGQMEDGAVLSANAAKIRAAFS